jgi:hypothetical protein
MSDKSSRTEHEQFWEEQLAGSEGHYKTTISDGEHTSIGTGDTSASSQENASDRFDGGNYESDSFCYLTTACVKSKNLPDNCLELEVLRGFRDKILMKDSRGKKAVKEYYKIAPEIVQAVENQENAQRIWNEVYGDIKHAVLLVLSGNHNEAFDHYKQMTLRLKKNYLN